MAKKKKEIEKYYAITLCGAFFFEDELIDFISDKIGEDASTKELIELMALFFDGVNFSQYSPFMKEVIMIHTDNVLYESDDPERKGVYIGIPFIQVPDHFSIKRVCVDVRNLFINSEIIDESAEADFVTVFNKILKVKEEA